MSDHNEDVRKLQEGGMRLRLQAESLQAGVEYGTLQRQRALVHYPRLRRLLAHCLRKAASGQGIASVWGQQLHGLRPELAALRNEMESLSYFGAEGLAGVQEDLAAVEQLIKGWSSPPESPASGE
jgi:hypothetical protein